MAEPKQIHNKPLLFALMALALGAALLVVHGKKAMSRDQARGLAEVVMQDVCARDCPHLSLSAADLKGPQDSDTHAAPSSSKYEFFWRAANGKALYVRIWDNGLTIQKASRWNISDRWERHD